MRTSNQTALACAPPRAGARYSFPLATTAQRPERIIVLPEPKILFQQLQLLAGTEAGARSHFQRLVTDLVKVEHPTADEVEAPGGQDWGIDTFVGNLGDTISVWQSKFFLEWTGETQRRQVRESFTQVLERATGNGIELRAWTLAIPISLPPVERKWFDDWGARQRRENGVAIRIWGGMELRHRLMRADAAAVFRHYFGEASIPLAVEGIATSHDLSEFDEALFVRQLHEAGLVETDAARGFFFAADALIRDVASRGDGQALAAIEELQLEVHNIWEDLFNRTISSADGQGRMSGFVTKVIKEAGRAADPEGLRLRPAHRRGVAHRLVEGEQAGWVAHWRQIAAEHRAARAPAESDGLVAQTGSAGASGT